MNPRVLTLTVAVLALIGASAGSLRWLKTRVRMGEPGVRIVRVPLISEEGRLAASNSVHIPSEIPGFRSRTEPVPELELTYLPPDTTFGRRSYHSSDGLSPVSASVVLMGSDRTSIHRPEYCMTGVGWQILSQTIRSIALNGGGPALEAQRFDMTREFELPNGRKVRKNGVYVFWFIADGVRTPSHSERQWRGIRDVLVRGLNPRWAYVSFFSACDPGEEEATFERVARVIAAAAPEIERRPDAIPLAAAVDLPR
jgi:hypothetical protein